MKLYTIKCVVFTHSLLSFIVAPVNNLKCYQCRSDHDKLCEDEIKLPEKYLRPCVDEDETEFSEEDDDGQDSSVVEKLAFPNYARNKRQSEKENEADIKNDEEINAKQTQFKCRKITQKLFITDPVETVVFRECTTHFYENECNKSSSKLLYLAVCDCSEDGCNSVKKMESLITSVKMYTMLLVVLLYLAY